MDIDKKAVVMDYEEKAREITDGLAGYIAEPRRTELAQDIAAAIREAVEGERDACAELSYSFSDPTPPALIGDAIRGRALSGEK